MANILHLIMLLYNMFCLPSSYVYYCFFFLIYVVFSFSFISYYIWFPIQIPIHLFVVFSFIFCTSYKWYSHLVSHNPIWCSTLVFLTLYVLLLFSLYSSYFMVFSFRFCPSLATSIQGFLRARKFKFMWTLIPKMILIRV